MKIFAIDLLRFFAIGFEAGKKFFVRFLIGCSLLAFSAFAQAPGDVRIALVIGNAAYVNVPALSNSTNDARAISTIMQKLGFKVFEVIDGDKQSMNRAIDNLKSKLNGQRAVAMLYYAGHGLQLDWRNYMLPVDANINSAQEVMSQSVDIDAVIKTFKAANTRMNIIVLDACRDNPFSDQATGKGLAQLDAPPGTYLAFATSPGNVAEDGDAESGNGLFTQFLIKELQKPARIEDVFKRVRLQVRQKSQGRQIPWDSSSLEEDFSFNDGDKHTFNPEDLLREAREAKEKEARLKAEAEAAKQREIQLSKQRELERIRLAAEQKLREQEAEAIRLKEIELAKQREMERQKNAEIQKIKETQEKLKAEADARERERLLLLAEAEQKRLAALAEQNRRRAELEAIENQKRLALAEEAERKKAQEAAKALESAKLAELERIKNLEAARQQLELETMLKKETAEKQFEIQKAEWDKIKDSRRVDDFYSFLNKYPSGFISEQALYALDKLQKAKIAFYPNKNGFVEGTEEARFKVGDTYAYVTRDYFNDNEISRSRFSVNKIDNGLVYFSSRQNVEVRIYTEDGALIKSGINHYDPPLPIQPGERFQVGKKWTAQTQVDRDGKMSNRTYDMKVVGADEVQVEAGNFKAYKVESYSIQDNGAKYHEIRWFQPGIGLPVKTEFSIRARNGKILRYEKTELVSYKLAQR